MRYDLTYLSFGAGVQSTALLVMSALGLNDVPKADCAIFADPGAELPSTYRHVEYMAKWAGERGIPVYTVKKNGLGLEDDLLQASSSRSHIPAFTLNGLVDKGMLRRKCTDEFKIMPIQNKIRELLGLKPRQRSNGKMALCMIGISLDEVIRMKPSRVPYMVNAHPLIDAKMTRHGCLALLEKHGIPKPPKSACHFCPFHGDRAWRELEATDPETFARSVKVDEAIRDLRRAGVNNPVYLHRSCKPLSERPFAERADQGKLFADGFENECSGLCGV